MRTAIAGMALLLFAAAAFATSVTVQRDGVAVEGAQVCRFAAGDGENPFKRWLMSPDVVCSAAGEIEFPPGLWNVFARTAGEVSASALLIGGDRAPQKVTISLDSSAAITAQLPEGSRAVVYVPRRGSAIPVRANERAIVPAGEEMWLVVLDKFKPAAVVPIAAIERGAERTVDARHGGPAAIVGWLQVPENERAALTTVRAMSSPAIRVSSGGATRDADPLSPFEVLNGSFFRIRNPAAGQGELTVGGRGFIPQRRRIEVSSVLTVVAEPLTVHASGTLIVHWSANPQTVALERSIGACDEKEEPPRFVISVSACQPPENAGGPVDPSTCSAVKEESFGPELSFGDVTLDELIPGTYRAEIRFGKLPPIAATTSVAPLQVRNLNLSASYCEIYGSLTRGGDPIRRDVVITFPGGYGFAAKDSSEYRGAYLCGLPPDTQFKVGACEGAPQAVVLNDRPLVRNTRFDIDIPANRLTIDVSDTFTREPLPSSTVRLTVMSISVPHRPVMTTAVTTSAGDQGDAGRATFESLPDRELRVNVSHSGYQSRNLEPFTMWKSENKRLDIQLVPLRGSQSRIVSDRTFESGAVYWFAPSGMESERVELGSDGTFVYGSSHDPAETMAVVSLSHPLWVTRSPEFDTKKSVTIAFPDAPAMRATVSVRGSDGRDAHFIGVVIGGVRVPAPVFRLHQELRRQPATIRGIGPTLIRDLLAVGPIDILLGPTTQELSPRVLMMDYFALPQFADVPRQRLAPGVWGVVFDVKR